MSFPGNFIEFVWTAGLLADRVVLVAWKNSSQIRLNRPVLQKSEERTAQAVKVMFDEFKYLQSKRLGRVEIYGFSFLGDQCVGRVRCVVEDPVVPRKEKSY